MDEKDKDLMRSSAQMLILQHPCASMIEANDEAEPAYIVARNGSLRRSEGVRLQSTWTLGREFGALVEGPKGCEGARHEALRLLRAMRFIQLYGGE